jgi:hypothetical protein
MRLSCALAPVASGWMLEVHKWRRKGTFTIPDVFQRSSYRMFYSENRCYRARVARERDIRLCRLYARDDYGPGFSSSLITKRLKTNLQAFRYALNLSAERPVRVLYADAMCSCPLLACSEYFRRRQAQSRLHGLQRHECSGTRHRVSFLSKMK